MAQIFSNEWQRSVRQRHIEQLRSIPFETDEKVIRDGTDITVNGLTPEEYADMVRGWIAAIHPQTQDAINSRVFTGKTLDTWNNIIMTSVENAAISMRVVLDVTRATEAAKAGKDDEAMQLLESADAYIKEFAGMIGLQYITICDLPHEPPVGHPFLVGPFCGMFWSEDPTHPFVGITFKGTDPNNYGEKEVDRQRDLVKVPGGVLYDTKVVRGMSTALFDTYTSLGGASAYDHIRDTFMSYPAQIAEPYMVHVTGHSLGGGYATLFHTELARQTAEIAPIGYELGDLYAFAAPRVGGEPFATAANEAASSRPGGIWRIVNEGDPVPMIPPVMLDLHVFFHVDGGILISPTAPPQDISTELGKPGPGPPDMSMIEILKRMSTYHSPSYYWISLANAAGVQYAPSA